VFVQEEVMNRRFTIVFAVVLCSSVAVAQIPINIPGLNLPPLQLPSIPGLPSSVPAVPTVPVPGLPVVGTPNAEAPTQDSSQPQYGNRTAIYSIPDERLEKLPEGFVPFLEVMQLERLATYQKNRETCRAEEIAGKGYSNASDCPQYEWSVPFSTEEASQDAARDLRRAWQTFEDRSYWRVVTELNNPAFVIAFCWVNWGGGLNPDRPTTRVTVRAEDLEPSLRDKIPHSKPDPQFNLDSYFPLPQVDNAQFCDDLNLEILPLMFIPGFCVAFFGVDVVCTPEYPKPIWFNDSKATKRVLSAIGRMHTKYLAEYQAETMKAMTPASSSDSTGQRLLFPLPWHSNVPGDGAFIAPITNTDVSPQQFLDLGQQASSILGGLEGANATAYYLQSVVRSPTLDWNVLPGRNDVVNTPPGIWKLEEFKRLLKPSNPTYYERIGYVNFFQAWNEVTTTVLPEPNWAKVTRPIIYWAVGLRVNIDPFTCGICVTPQPAPVPVAPFLVPFVGPRMNWTWTSVPEGYSIPRVVGDPLFDYRPLLRTEALK
jgi:hypothetical protein